MLPVIPRDVLWDATKMLAKCATARASDLLPPGWPMRPIIDLCMVAVGHERWIADLEARVEAMEDKLK